MSGVPRKAKAGLIVALVAVLVGAPAGVGYAAYSQDAPMRGLLPKGTVVGGVDVSRLQRPAALAKVTAVVERDFDRKVTVTVGGHAYTTSLRALGARDDAKAAVGRAFAAASAGNWLTRAWHRVVDGTSAPREDVKVVDHDPAKLEALVTRAVADVSVAPTNGEVHSAGGWLTFTRGKFGRTVDRDAVRKAFVAALKDGSPRSVDSLEVPPGPSVETAILVRTGENKLYLYQHGRITRTFGVATGSPRYPTPHGRFEVVLKRYLPTWVNPWSPWSMHEPARIGPGPNNPLGTRAMNLSAPGIRIHGTPADRSIGYSVSHGCIRMHIPDVEALYPLVPTHTPVFILSAGPPRLPGAKVDTGAVADGG
ncbi:MAG TPA: L,D-transpeptidase family protein [Mycobacteriales bacterium]|nr:L,D-transpeptidase family protein [Mycobacteriales bacterium]